MNELRFDNKVAIVTGAGGGLGRAYAMLLARRGAKVLVNDIGCDISGKGFDKGPARKVVDEIRAAGGIAVADSHSVADTTCANAIVQNAMHLWGGVDILINNAGVVTSVGTLDQLGDSSYDADMGVAAGGTFRLMRAVWRHMWDKNYGRIVNVASGSFFGMGSAIPYPAAIGAVLGMTRSTASATDARQRDVKINVVMSIACSRLTVLMGEGMEKAMCRDFPAEAVAPVVALLAHEKCPCNGEFLSAGGGGFRRVFVGATPGYQREDRQLTMEDALAHFPDAMRTDGFKIPRHALEEAVMYPSGVNWDALIQLIQ